MPSLTVNQSVVRLNARAPSPIRITAQQTRTPIVLGETGGANIDEILAAIRGGAPAELDTLNKLARAINDDPNFAATIRAAIDAKLSAADLSTLVGNLISTWAFQGDASELPESKIPELNADKITDGVFDDARIPNLDASKINGGVFDDSRIPATIARDSEVASAVDSAINNLVAGAPGALDTLAELAAAINDDANFAATVTASLATKINQTQATNLVNALVAGWALAPSGAALPDAKIPNLDASKIAAGVLALARIPSLPASRTTSGQFATARIPNLDAGKITSGTFDAARLPPMGARIVYTANPAPRDRAWVDTGYTIPNTEAIICGQDWQITGGHTTNSLIIYPSSIIRALPVASNLSRVASGQFISGIASTATEGALSFARTSTNSLVVKDLNTQANRILHIWVIGG